MAGEAPFTEGESRPMDDEEKCIQQIKNLVRDLVKEFKTTSTVIRNYLRRYLEDPRGRYRR